MSGFGGGGSGFEAEAGGGNPTGYSESGGKVNLTDALQVGSATGMTATGDDGDMFAGGSLYNWQWDASSGNWYFYSSAAQNSIVALILGTPAANHGFRTDSTGVFGWTSSTGNANGNPDTTLSRASAGVVAIGNGTTAGGLNLLGTNGALIGVRSASQELTALSGASASTTSLVPAGCTILYVVARVTTLITGATTFDVGDGTDVDRYGAAIAVAAGTTVDETDGTADPRSWSASAQDVTLTANGSNFTAGAVRITAFYLDPTAPTS